MSSHPCALTSLTAIVLDLGMVRCQDANEAPDHGAIAVEVGHRLQKAPRMPLLGSHIRLGGAAATSSDEQIIERLDLILRVLALQVGETKSLTERIRLLKLAGLSNQTIADVLNTTPATVRALGSNLRTRRRIAL